jgi:hypothetical protein
VDAESIIHLVPLMSSKDEKLRRQVCSCLGQIAKHSVHFAELVVEREIFPEVIDRLKDSDVYVRKNAAILVREITKHTPEVCMSFTSTELNIIASGSSCKCRRNSGNCGLHQRKQRVTSPAWNNDFRFCFGIFRSHGQSSN